MINNMFKKGLIVGIMVLFFGAGIVPSINGYYSVFRNVSSNDGYSETDSNIYIGKLPESFCWRDINGTDFTTQIRDQVPCGACEAFTAAAIIESLIQFKVGYPFDCDLSEAHLFFWTNGTCDFGTNITDIMNFLLKYGIPDEGCFPYPHRWWETPKNETLPDWENRAVKITGWGWVKNDSLSLKKALIEYGPLGVLINEPKDLVRYNGGVFYPKEVSYPGHWLALVGYNDSENCWIIKNSWGKYWGEEGWLKLSYDADIFITGNNTWIENITGGGTGVFYIEDVYGNLQPEVPHIKIISPKRSFTYFKDKFWKNIIFRFPFYNDVAIYYRNLGRQKFLFKKIIFDIRTPKIFRGTDIEVNATGNNVSTVEIYIDNVLKYSSDLPDFEWYWNVDVDRGRHEIKSIVYDDEGVRSKDTIDIYVFI